MIVTFLLFTTSVLHVQHTTYIITSRYDSKITSFACLSHNWHLFFLPSQTYQSVNSFYVMLLPLLV